MDEEIIDRRPDPKPRAHPQLWQSYLWWDELMQMRKRHTLRASSADRGKSNLDAQFERDVMGHMAIDDLLKEAEKSMASYGNALGPVWDWMVGIRGIGAHTAAKILALIDDPGKFETISKLWRFSGYAVVDGQIDRASRGEKLHYNRRLKSELHLIAVHMVMSQTPMYVDVYYEEKARQQAMHPEPICSKCGAVGQQKGQSWHCTQCAASGRALLYTPDHLHNRAQRKMIKVFLSHLWLIWREQEGLPVSLPYVAAVLGHEHIILPEPLAVV